MKSYVVCGIDTGIGKSVVTGLLANHLLAQGKSVLTQKLVQTGCADKPEDILLHRSLMGSDWHELDEQGLTCPYCFPFPASPHLAARLAGKQINPTMLDWATAQLAERCDTLLIETAGGLLVPLTDDLLLIDYLAAREHSLILVTSPRLGSINHTLLCLEAIKQRNMPLAGLVYNLFEETPQEIVDDSRQVFSRYLRRLELPDRIVDLPSGLGSVNWGLITGS